MNINKIFKRQTYLIVGAIIILLLIFITISYAYFTSTKTSQGNVVVKSGDLEVAFNGSNVIDGKLEPMSNTEGMNSEGYTFRVTNTGSLNTAYKVEIYVDKSVTGTHVPHQYVMISYNGGVGRQLSNIPKSVVGSTEGDNIYLIGTGIIIRNNTKDNVIKLWIKEDAPTSIKENKVAFKIKVTSEVKSGELAGTQPIPPYTLTKSEWNTGEYAEIGDTIGITVNGKTENFYVISNVNHNISAMAYYNLNVGESQYKENGVVVNAGIQDEHVFSYKSGFTKYGNVAFSDNITWSAGDNNLEKKNVGPANTALYDEATGYEKYIQQTIPEATIRLIQKSELDELGCNMISSGFGQCNTETITNNHREWVYSTTYWTGSAWSDIGSGALAVWVVRTNGELTNNSYYDSIGHGIRPVVEFYEFLVAE